ncbi:hypothetical protein PO181_10570 [Leuconostoc suionicum]|uniref:hypothetical protein n=1 Tax=Leuconostoc suionicum TaxID=1511761 RepID=UPI00233E8734|nr:hypothetical protein [Leuconostoc suionicum]MDC2805137.1 hypothetical protein [Leuconostoc suionicum]MDC2817411.1 hypothetical protein [Leuconostoc suionicum]MDC2822649.1 hypothetical protein [Leuconostoc suionicum]
MAVDIIAIERTRLSLVNGSRNLSLMLDKLRLIEEIRDVDVFGFTQDIVDLMKYIESSQEQLDAYIKDHRKLV